jgi:hypothetical protein
MRSYCDDCGRDRILLILISRPSDVLLGARLGRGQGIAIATWWQDTLRPAPVRQLRRSCSRSAWRMAVRGSGGRWCVAADTARSEAKRPGRNPRQHPSHARSQVLSWQADVNRKMTPVCDFTPDVTGPRSKIFELRFPKSMHIYAESRAFGEKRACEMWRHSR